jgi:DNA-binding LacI/PurR family transcriptional regulator
MNQNNIGFSPAADVAEAEERLRDYLRRPDFKVGSRLPSERELAHAVGLGRTAFRPLLGTLEKEGVVERRPQSGTYLLKVPISRPNGRKVFLITSIGHQDQVHSQREPNWIFSVTSAFEHEMRVRSVDLEVTDQVSNPESLEKLVGRAIDSRAQAVVFVHPNGSNDSLWSAAGLLHDAGVHAVVAVEGGFPAIASSVYFDIDWGTYLATRRLIQCGHQRIAYLGASGANEPLHDGIKGFERALDVAQVGEQGRCKWIARESTDEVLRQWHALPPARRPTAIVAGDDAAALKILDAAREQAISVPGKLSLVGLGNTPMAQIAGLTTLALPAQRLGEELARVTLERLVQGELAVAVTHHLQPVLIERSTMGPPTPHADQE